MSPRSVLRIARWEVTRGAGSVDRRTVIAALVVLAVLGAAAPALAGGAASPERGIYPVGVAPDSPYRPAVERAASLRAVHVDADAVVRVTPRRVAVADTPKGAAALAALREAVRSHNTALMRAEDDAAAAFPVTVDLRYAEQPGAGSGEAGGGGRDPDAGAGGTGGDADTGGEGTDSGGESPASADRSGDGGGADDGTAGAGGGVLSGLFGGSQSGSPAAIQPPFPLQSLLLAFAFLLPLNVVSQAYGSSVVAERIDRRGEALLVAPVTRAEVIAGKTLPYFLAALLVAAGIAAVVGGGPLSVLAVVPLAALFLAATFVGAMLARSFKELTFVTVAVSVLVTSYAFVPAVFTSVHPVAAISPLTLVVWDLGGEAVAWTTVAFATVPMTVAAGLLFALGAGVFREEDMFTQKPLPGKALDALAAHLSSARRVAVWSALAVPFVFVAELFALALLFVVPQSVAVPALLVVLAVIEEVAKSLHVLAGFERARLPRTRRAALLAGLASGVGFAVAEKALLVVQVVGLPDLALGEAAFASAAAPDPATALGLLLAPFALHVVTATCSALGARRSRTGYGLGLAAAVLLHAAYNLGVVVALG